MCIAYVEVPKLDFITTTSDEGVRSGVNVYFNPYAGLCEELNVLPTSASCVVGDVQLVLAFTKMVLPA